MILISHRGNIKGKNIEKENSINYIETAFSFNIDVEIDVWFINNKWYLGHDEPNTEFDWKWLDENKNKIWVHCKNIESIIALKNTDIHYFWHENDKITLTSKNYIWAFPSENKIKESIDVLPEKFPNVISNCLGICSDYILDFDKR